MAICNGTSKDHCCWVGKQGICPHLIVQNDEISCGLLNELGTWEAVYADPRYLADVQHVWDKIAPGKGCGDWPLPGTTCNACGVTNNG